MTFYYIFTLKDSEVHTDVCEGLKRTRTALNQSGYRNVLSIESYMAGYDLLSIVEKVDKNLHIMMNHFF